MSTTVTEVVTSDSLVFDEYKEKMCRYFGDLAPELENVRSLQELYEILRKARLRVLHQSARAIPGSPLQERLRRRGMVSIAKYMQEIQDEIKGMKA